MDAVYGKLGALGLPRTFVRRAILPSWWDDEAACTPAGLSQALMLIQRHAGVDLRSLREADAPVRFLGAVPCRLKATRRRARSGARSAEAFVAARALAVSAAQAAIAGTAVSAHTIPAASSVRDEILSLGRPWVGLADLADYCWDHGVPLLHLSGLPRQMPRMQGLAARVADRFAIVSADAHRSPAWQLFIVAHELGHVALGHHHGESGALVDETVDRESRDAEEAEANRYAVELLAAGQRFRAHERWLSAAELARQAARLGQELHVDPGHIALNYGHAMEFTPVAMAALRLLEADADGPALLQKRLAERLDWPCLPADTSEFLMRLSGPQRAEAA